MPFSKAADRSVRSWLRGDEAALRTVTSYVSGHGFGHTTRTIEVLSRLAAIVPDLHLDIRTTAPRELFEYGLNPTFSYESVTLDAGVVQADSLSPDPTATLERYASIARNKAALVADEVRRLRDREPVLIVADIPAIAFDIAAALAVPGVAVANFSWDWIYEDYVSDLPEFRWVLADLRASYAQADLLLRLPMSAEMPAFPQVEDVPLIARRATVGRSEARDRLGLLRSRPLVLLTFGGLGLDLSDLPELPSPEMTYVLPGADREPPLGYTAISDRRLREAGLRFPDLVGAADVVVTKPGYGIVAECVANRTAIVFTSRGRFAEYPVLVEYLQHRLPNAFIGNEELRSGQWSVPIRAALDAPWPAIAEPIDGAEVIARKLSGYL